MPYLDRPDARIYYDVDDFTDPWTKPPTLFMHHGHARSGRFWYSLVPLLARNYRIVRIDARAFGRSSVPPAGYPWTPDVFIGDACALMDHLGVERAIWVGEFLGNVVGMAFALKHPDRLDAMVQFHPICSHADVKDFPHTAGGENTGELRRSIEAEGLGEWSRKTLWHRLDVENAPPEMAQWVADQVAATSPVSVMNLRPHVGNWTQAVTDRLAAIRTPNLLLLADKSPNSTRFQADFMVSTMPNARLAVLSGFGNCMWMLKPEWCATQIRDFLSDISRRGA